MNANVKIVLKKQSKFFDFAVTIEDIHPFRAGGGDHYTATVIPKGVGKHASELASKIYKNKLRCFVERISKEDVIAIAQAKGMSDVPIMPGDVASGMKQA